MACVVLSATFPNPGYLYFLSLLSRCTKIAFPENAHGWPSAWFFEQALLQASKVQKCSLIEKCSLLLSGVKPVAKKQPSTDVHDA